ncbi:MAG: hypothetical protein HGB32_08520 [Geobacteraceae bacterium]|nr:hypothetical protein [Geobacteraceae bacterium]NTW80178.1 hypothetical protein [Geobacteraceae bacterium]
MNILINYANDVFRESQKLNSIAGKEVGLFDEVISYSPQDIDTDFFNRNKRILQQNRGNGYWLWKPYFIKKTLEAAKYGDFVFYCDSGSYFIRPVTPLIDSSVATGQEIVVFDLTYLEREWTKRDAFILMDCDSEKYSESIQRLGSFSLWKKSTFTMNFVDEYLRYAQDERIISDMENQCGYPNYPEFKEHRHDQSIFSLLTKKYDLKAYRDPSQFGNGKTQQYPNSEYEQLIEHTRMRSKKVPFIVMMMDKIKTLTRTW